MILDSNVVIAMFQQEQFDLFDRLAEWQATRRIYVNTIIYAEVAPSFVSQEGMKSALDELGLIFAELSLDEAYRAGQAFAEYRRRGGTRKSILPDFLIGAQAAVRGWPLVTRDRKGFASYFPEVELIDPMTPTP